MILQSAKVLLQPLLSCFSEPFSRLSFELFSSFSIGFIQTPGLWRSWARPRRYILLENITVIYMMVFTLHTECAPSFSPSALREIPCKWGNTFVEEILLYFYLDLIISSQLQDLIWIWQVSVFALLSHKGWDIVYLLFLRIFHDSLVAFEIWKSRLCGHETRTRTRLRGWLFHHFRKPGWKRRWLQGKKYLKSSGLIHISRPQITCIHFSW